jgi:hypothetical protein
MITSSNDVRKDKSALVNVKTPEDVRTGIGSVGSVGNE